MAEQKQKNADFRTSIGGQALIEGIMMRGPKKQAIVCRTPEGFKTQITDVRSPKEKSAVLGWPLIRGVVNFIASMTAGVKALMFSAECLPEEEQEEPSKLDLWIEKHFNAETAGKLIISLSVVFGVAVAVGLFILLPTFLAGLFAPLISAPLLRSLAEGLLRIVIFIAYIWLCSRLKDIKRVWQYHGAEHKTIFCYEKGLPLTVENVRPQRRFHPRCGTSFLFLVMIVSILLFSFVKWSNVWTRMLFRLLLLPVVVGISYELIKFAGRHDNLLTKIISAPGKALQRLTTAEPDDSMIETAIEALKLVIPEEKGADAW